MRRQELLCAKCVVVSKYLADDAAAAATATATAASTAAAALLLLLLLLATCCCWNHETSAVVKLTQTLFVLEHNNKSVQNICPSLTMSSNKTELQFQRTSKKRFYNLICFSLCQRRRGRVSTFQVTCNCQANVDPSFRIL